MSKIVDRIFNTTLTGTDSTAQEELGAFRFEDGRIYRYVNYTDAVTALAGGPVLVNGTNPNIVTSDVDGGAGAGAVIGCSIAAAEVNNYAWIQIYGLATVKVMDYITAGDLLFACTTDNVWSVSKTDAPGYGFLPGARALNDVETDKATFCSAFIRL